MILTATEPKPTPISITGHNQRKVTTMRGLVEESGTNNLFLQVKYGTICEVSKHALAGFEAITVNNPKTGESVTKYIKRYKGVEALVTKIEYYDTEKKYDTTFRGIKIHLNANGVQCVLDLPEDSRPFTRFLKTAENIDFTQPVEFRAWMDAEKKTAFAIKQNDENVSQKYTRAEPGDCPEPTQTRKGWDYTAQEDYLHDILIETIIPRVEAAENAEGVGRPRTVVAQVEAVVEEDVPFDEIEEWGKPEDEPENIPLGTVDDSIREALNALNYSDIAMCSWIEKRYGQKTKDWRTLSTRIKQEALAFLDDLAERKGVKAVF
jgi:hypothetical protein